MSGGPQKQSHLAARMTTITGTFKTKILFGRLRWITMDAPRVFSLLRQELAVWSVVGAMLSLVGYLNGGKSPVTSFYEQN